MTDQGVTDLNLTDPSVTDQRATDQILAEQPRSEAPVAEAAHPIEQLPLNERAAAYEQELEVLRDVLEGADTDRDFGA